jgi:predicted phosphodiesterase
MIKLDILIFGYTYQSLIKKVDNLLLLNLGTTIGSVSSKGERKEKTYAI